MSVKIVFGAHRYRCEYCRVHFASFRKRQEVFSFRRWEKMGYPRAESAGKSTAIPATVPRQTDPEEQPSPPPELEMEEPLPAEETAAVPVAAGPRKKIWIWAAACMLLVAALGVWALAARHSRQQPGFDSSDTGATDTASTATVRPAVPQGAVSVRKGTTRVNPADGLTYVYISPGTFEMGCSPGDDACESDEKPSREVQITNGFWLGQTEVTQSAWKKVNGGADPSIFKGDQLPVENVSWNEAGAYCKAIGGRLPTEKEWEYAARGGTKGALYGELDAVAWYSGNSIGLTHPVGLKQANPFDLYDMLGNVWEWTSDDYNAEKKTCRGGSWRNGLLIVRASYRDRNNPTFRNNQVGLRCATDLPAPAQP
jgi:formylglycine-generating enzyme required for sulfatase activity